MGPIIGPSGLPANDPARAPPGLPLEWQAVLSKGSRPMNRRKLAFKQGLTALRSKKAPLLTRPRRNICAIRPSLYNAGGMLDLNKIIQGDSTKVLNDMPQ